MTMLEKIPASKITALLVSALVLGATPLATADEHPGQQVATGNLKVMTQNLYVGADLFKILDPSNPVPVNAAEIFSDIQATDFWQRAEAIANLIADQNPHLVGLQEVSLIRTQCPSDLVAEPALGPNATLVYSDYLQMLLEALNARGLHYEVAASVTNADVELPVLNLGLLPTCGYPFFDARLTDRDVTLRRSDVDVTFAYSDNYTANFPVPTPAGPVEFIRGYNVVDVDLNGRNYRFVNTHLEVNGDPYANFFQFAQAAELTQVLNFLASALADRVVVLVGDFNSDPAFGDTQPCILPPFDGPLVFCDIPYTVMRGAGFIDTWTVRKAPPGEGFTCCQDDLLANENSLLDQRFDHIWLRAPFGGSPVSDFLVTSQVRTVGDDQEDRTVDWLWPSDHAGVFANMVIRQAR
jgi:endonuclease/exonuclease/phosphatase family metal-dependent hydrolase